MSDELGPHPDVGAGLPEQPGGAQEAEVVASDIDLPTQPDNDGQTVGFDSHRQPITILTLPGQNVTRSEITRAAVRSLTTAAEMPALEGESGSEGSARVPREYPASPGGSDDSAVMTGREGNEHLSVGDELTFEIDGEEVRALIGSVRLEGGSDIRIDMGEAQNQFLPRPNPYGPGSPLPTLPEGNAELASGLGATSRSLSVLRRPDGPSLVEVLSAIPADDTCHRLTKCTKCGKVHLNNQHICCMLGVTDPADSFRFDFDHHVSSRRGMELDPEVMGAPMLWGSPLDHPHYLRSQIRPRDTLVGGLCCSLPSTHAKMMEIRSQRLLDEMSFFQQDSLGSLSTSYLFSDEAWLDHHGHFRGNKVRPLLAELERLMKGYHPTHQPLAPGYYEGIETRAQMAQPTFNKMLRIIRRYFIVRTANTQ